MHVWIILSNTCKFILFLYKMIIFRDGLLLFLIIIFYGVR